MTSIAVVAHAGKTLGEGLPALRRRLAAEVDAEPMWFEVPKSRMAGKVAKRCLKAGAELIIVWGGDGTVQRVIDVVAGQGVTLAVIPAGTANLFATNIGVPADLDAALDIALHGGRRDLDVGVINGEHFGVMAGAGFDAAMIKAADGRLKDRLGRAAYVITGTKAAWKSARKVKVSVDGTPWFDGRAGCVLLGNMGTVSGGLQAFPDADPADGKLEVGVVTAGSPVQWARVMARLATKKVDRSPLAQTTQARKVDIKFSKSTVYELDGGDRPATRQLKARIKPLAITVAVPNEEAK